MTVEVGMIVNAAFCQILLHASLAGGLALYIAFIPSFAARRISQALSVYAQQMKNKHMTSVHDNAVILQ